MVNLADQITGKFEITVPIRPHAPFVFPNSRVNKGSDSSSYCLVSLHILAELIQPWKNEDRRLNSPPHPYWSYSPLQACYQGQERNQCSPYIMASIAWVATSPEEHDKLLSWTNHSLAFQKQLGWQDHSTCIIKNNNPPEKEDRVNTLGCPPEEGS